MPDWCSNQVTIYAGSEDLGKIKEVLKGVEADPKKALGLVETFYPCPFPTDRGVDERWYDWQCENWGVKWGDKDLTLVAHAIPARVYPSRLVMSGRRGLLEGIRAIKSAFTEQLWIQVTYETPWGPMTKALTELSKKYGWSFTEIFDSTVDGFMGVNLVADGRIVASSEITGSTIDDFISDDGFDNDGYLEYHDNAWEFVCAASVRMENKHLENGKLKPDQERTNYAVSIYSGDKNKEAK